MITSENKTAGGKGDNFSFRYRHFFFSFPLNHIQKTFSLKARIVWYTLNILNIDQIDNSVFFKIYRPTIN